MEPPSAERTRPRAKPSRTLLRLTCLTIAVLTVGSIAFPIVAGAGASAPRPVVVPIVVPAAVHHTLIVTSPDLNALVGSPVTLYAAFPNGAAGKSFHWQFGDGTKLKTTKDESTHTYTEPGLYAVVVKAKNVTGAAYDDRNSILLVNVVASTVNDVYGNTFQLAGSILANGTSTVRPTAFLAPGGSLTVQVRVTSPPTDTEAVLGAPTFSVSGKAATHAKFSGVVLNASSNSTATVTFSASTPKGLYRLTYAELTTTPINGTRINAYSNYTFSVVIGTGLGGTAVPVPTDPNPTVLRFFGAGPTTFESFDPAIFYDQPDGAVIGNVYQTLIAYNGSDVGPGAANYVPELATCVPGSALCTKLYGTSLATSSELTFVINNRSEFYDPATKAAWGVWPTDVLFSAIRTMAFSTYPSIEFTNGWMLAQSLLPTGSYAWDGGFHAPLNNTPANVFAAVQVNNSAHCPKAALAAGQHGCVTFFENAAPYNPGGFRSVLSVLAQPYGAITPCGWFSAAAQGAGIPYWTVGNVSGAGDHPCGAPGSKGYGVASSAIPATGWDSWEYGATGYPPAGVVTSTAAGSGAYYLAATAGNDTAVLEANPNYTNTPTCTFAGCLPNSVSFPTVDINDSVSVGTADALVSAGMGDVAPYAGGAASPLFGAITAGTAQAVAIPDLNEYQEALFVDYNVSAASAIAGVPLTAPGTVFSDLNLRQFLIHAYPYAEIQQTVSAIQGVPQQVESGGAIPGLMGPWSPTNISWPNTVPDPNPSDVGGAAWWWNRTAHDAWAGANCTTKKPCSFLLPYVTNDTANQAAMSLWGAEIRNLSGGAMVPVIAGESFLTQILGYFTAPGNAPNSVAYAGWAPDYPDAWDYVTPYYTPGGIFASGADFQPELDLFNASGCSTSIGFWATLSTPIPLDCQGAAYDAMNAAFTRAGNGAANAADFLLYNEGEHVAAALGLYVDTGQGEDVTVLAPWIAASSLPTNPMLQDWDAETEFSLYHLATSASGAHLAVRGPIPPSGAEKVGAAFDLTAVGTGGSGGYTYSWSGLPAGCASANASTLNCTPSAKGHYAVAVTVTDSAGKSVTSAALSVTVTDRRRPRATRPPRAM